MHFPDFTVLASISLYMIISFWEGQANSPVMSQANTILINHVIASIQSNSLHCMQACATTSNCYSINQYPGCGRCELNSATHLSHPWDMVSDADGSYMIYNLRLYICSYSLCQDDKMCELNADGLTHNCKAKYFDIYVRSETADDPRRTPGTIGISSIVVDGREYASVKPTKDYLRVMIGAKGLKA
ncbi:uncharacterized protein LOC116607366 isoform X2 [Nematostella vectensis]|uniref:uncharacterized protein LOC116607366 isoform X2 n=1 Tax=Nematostella vectensis TaxID=45351 RepID=UPI00138FCEA4|nr:uncharacterized protein LOC116607366 isoform X2 [Nematostella vectensis]